MEKTRTLVGSARFQTTRKRAMSLSLGNASKTKEQQLPTKENILECCLQVIVLLHVGHFAKSKCAVGSVVSREDRTVPIEYMVILLYQITT